MIKLPQIDKKKMQVIGIAIGMGLLALFLVNKYTEQRIVTAVSEIAKTRPGGGGPEGPAAPAGPAADVVVAVSEVARGQIVDGNMVTIKAIPEQFIQPGAITALEEAMGKMAIVDILPDEQVTASKLGPPGSSRAFIGGTLSLKTPSGKRAVTIPIDTLSAAGGMVRPGDYVDIIGNFPVPQMVQGQLTTQLATVTLFQNVLILAVDNELSYISRRKGEEAAAPPPLDQIQKIAFALPPKEAELLLFASEQGRLKLILRQPLDAATSPLPVATWDALLQYILGSQVQQSTMSVASPEKQREEKLPEVSLEFETPEERTVEIYRAGSLAEEACAPEKTETKK